MKLNAKSGKLHRHASKTFKRMLTSDYSNMKSKINNGEEDETTLYGSIKVRQQQLDCYSNLYKPSMRNHPR